MRYTLQKGATQIPLTDLEQINEILFEEQQYLIENRITTALLTVQEKIPTRTGQLFEELLRNSFYEFYIQDNTLLFRIYINQPQGYPEIISNPQHNNQLGYGKKPYPQTRPNPHVNVIRLTEKGALYILNDPLSEGDYKAAMTLLLQQALLLHIVTQQPQYQIKVLEKQTSPFPMPAQILVGSFGNNVLYFPEDQDQFSWGISVSKDVLKQAQFRREINTFIAKDNEDFEFRRSVIKVKSGTLYDLYNINVRKNIASQSVIQSRLEMMK